MNREKLEELVKNIVIGDITGTTAFNSDVRRLQPQGKDYAVIGDALVAKADEVLKSADEIEVQGVHIMVPREEQLRRLYLFASIAYNEASKFEELSQSSALYLQASKFFEALSQEDSDAVLGKR